MPYAYSSVERKGVEVSEVDRHAESGFQFPSMIAF